MTFEVGPDTQIEVLESIMADSLALSLSTDLSKKRIGEVTISPAELVTVDVERDGGGDWLVREAGSTRRSGSLMTLRTRSGSAGRSLVVVRADLGGHLEYSRRWSGVRAGVLLGARGAVRRGENRGGL